MRIATFNLESFGGRRHEEALSARIAALRPKLERLDADVLCLQEIGAERVGKTRDFLALDQLVEGTRYAGYRRVATTNDAGTKPRDVHNLVILSRYPVRARRQLLHHYAPEPVVRRVTAEPPEAEPVSVRWDRPVLHASLDVGGGRRVEVINLHLRAPLASAIPGQKESPLVWRTIRGWAEGAYLSAIKRAGQAFEARCAIEELFDADSGALIVVCGDFNADGREAALVILRGAVEETGNPALALRTLVPIELSLPPERRYTVVHAGSKLMLDHVMVSRGMLARFRGAAVHNELLSDELFAYYAGRNDLDSYHAPVVATFDL